MVSFSNFTLILTICSSVILHCRHTVGFKGLKSKYSDKSLRRDTPDTVRSIFFRILRGTSLLHVPQIAILLTVSVKHRNFTITGPVTQATQIRGIDSILYVKRNFP